MTEFYFTSSFNLSVTAPFKTPCGQLTHSDDFITGFILDISKDFLFFVIFISVCRDYFVINTALSAINLHWFGSDV